MDDSIFIFLAYGTLVVHIGSGMGAQQTCKACQNCLHPRFVIVHKAVRMHYYCFVVKAPANAIMQHKQRQLGQNKC